MDRFRSSIYHPLSSVQSLITEPTFQHALYFSCGLATGFGAHRYLWPRRYILREWRFARRPHHLAGYCYSTHSAKGRLMQWLARNEANNPHVSTVLRRSGYAIGYCNKRRSPLWASFLMCEASVTSQQRRIGYKNNFAMDKDLAPKSRSKKTDFIHSGYDRGHLAPLASVGFSERAGKETFLLSNVVLQDPALNRQLWSKLEKSTRLWAQLHNAGPLAVCVGPVFAQNREALSVNELPVPHYFFMAVQHCETKQGIGFFVPNEPPPPGQSVTMMGMSIAALEDKVRATSGVKRFSLFRALPRRFLTDLDARERHVVDLKYWPFESPAATTVPPPATPTRTVARQVVGPRHPAASVSASSRSTTTKSPAAPNTHKSRRAHKK